MKWWSLGLVATFGLLPVVQAQKLLQAVPEFPSCAISCFTAAAPQSTCAVNNDTCLCHDQTLTVLVGGCIQTNCTIKEALFTQNLTMNACGFPIRNQSHSYEVLSITLLVITCLFVIHRLAVRYMMLGGLGADDWVIAVTILLVIASTVVSSQGLIPNGLGRDLWTLHPDQITTFLRYYQAAASLYFAEISLIKISLLLFYLRIFPSQIVRYIIWGALIFNALYGLLYILLTIFICHPLSYFWNQWDGEHKGKCADLNALAATSASISIFADFCVLLIPLIQIKSLNLDWKKKVGVGLMFILGTFVTIISILRLRYVLKFASNTQDATWDYMPVAIWTVIEIDIGIICTCLPTFRTFLAHTFTRTFGTIVKSTDQSYNTGGSNKHGWSEGSKKNTILSTISKYNPTSPTSPRTDMFSANDHSDTDEAGLVELREMDRNGSISAVSSNVNIV